MFKLVSIFCLMLACGLAAKYPSDLPKCRYGDVVCIKSAIEHIIPLAKDGLPALNIVPINPIKINKVELQQNENGPVTVKLSMTNVEIFGIDTIQIEKLIGFGSDIENSKFELYGKLPFMNVIADYEMNGRILILPITGSGKSNITTLDNTYSIKLQPKLIEKNGKKYLKVKKINYRAEPKNAKLHLTNLFGGDEQLGRTMNTFLNENWKEIYGEMRYGIENAIGKILTGLMNNIFSKIEYSELFINE